MTNAKRKRTARGWRSFSAAASARFGWLSLHVFPDVLVKWGWLRIALLVVSPLGSGLVSREMARWRQQQNAYGFTENGVANDLKDRINSALDSIGNYPHRYPFWNKTRFKRL